jgi:hypothetical protein
MAFRTSHTKLKAGFAQGSRRTCGLLPNVSYPRGAQGEFTIEGTTGLVGRVTENFMNHRFPRNSSSRN